MPTVTLEWPHGRLSALSTGAMVASLEFVLPSGRPFRPFARAPWVEAGERDTGLAPHLQVLGAEFACVPFGVGGPLAEIAPEWRALDVAAVNDPPHGPAANAEWALEAETATALRFGLDYPEGHPVRRLTRSIAVDPAAAAVDFSLTIAARRAGRISVGLHPILTLAMPDESLAITADFDFGLTYPAAVPGGAMLTAIGRTFDRLAAVPAAGGGTVDLSRLPKPRPAEDVVQLCGMRGPVEIAFRDARARLAVDWDRVLLPSCQLWIGDRALTSPPWNGGYRGLGIEPNAAAFDLADAVSSADNPISARGVATTVALDPDRPVEIRYRLAAREDG